MNFFIKTNLAEDKSTVYFPEPCSEIYVKTFLKTSVISYTRRESNLRKKQKKEEKRSLDKFVTICYFCTREHKKLCFQKNLTSNNLLRKQLRKQK